MDRKKGSDAGVEMSEIKDGAPRKIFFIQVAPLSCAAATQVPETTAAIHSFFNAGFPRAVQVELLFTIGGLQPVTKAVRSPSFRKFCSQTCFGPLKLIKDGEPCGNATMVWRRRALRAFTRPRDDRREGGAKQDARGPACFSRIVPAVLESTLHVR